MSSSRQLNTVGGLNTGEDEADEVKVFRNETDELEVASSSAELNADKKDVAMEADIESESLDGNGSAFSGVASQQFQNRDEPRNPFFSMPSASNSDVPLLPLLMSPVGSPFFTNIIRNSPNIAAAAAIMSMSPSFGMPPAANAFGGFNGMIAPSMAATAAVQQHQANLAYVAAAAAALSPMYSSASLPSTPLMSRATSGNGGMMLGSPLTSMANGLGGMSLTEKMNRVAAGYGAGLYSSNQNTPSSAHTTPKRPKLSMSGCNTAPSASNNSHPFNSGQSSNGTTPSKTPKREKMSREEKLKDKDHVKKPCNAFMWYMRVNRPRLLSEDGGQPQSAIINKRMGIEWQALSKAEQQPYFDMAAKEREEHLMKHPDWTARDNYAVKKKQKKKAREKSRENNEQKKCRARYGIENQIKWCKHCRRKKKCLNVSSPNSSSHQVTSTTSNFNNNNNEGGGNSLGQPLAISTAMPTDSTLAASLFGGLHQQLNNHHHAQHVSSSSLSNPSSAASSSTPSSSATSTTSSAASSARHVDSPLSSSHKRSESNASSSASSSFDHHSSSGGIGTPPLASAHLLKQELQTPLAASNNTSTDFATPKASASGGLTKLESFDAQIFHPKPLPPSTSGSLLPTATSSATASTTVPQMPASVFDFLGSPHHQLAAAFFAQQQQNQQRQQQQAVQRQLNNNNNVQQQQQQLLYQAMFGGINGGGAMNPANSFFRQ